MKKFLSSVVLAAGFLVGVAAQAQVQVQDAWIRATVPSAKSSGMFMRLTSKRDAQLVEVRAGVADLAEIHQMQMDGQIMRMHAVPALALPAGQTVNLASGGFHIMLLKLQRQLKEGETVPVTLVIREGKRTETMVIDVAVKPLTYNRTP